MAKKCLKCGYERQSGDSAPDYECPKCGAVYAKVEAAIKRQSVDDVQPRSIQQVAPRTNKVTVPAHTPQKTLESKHVIRFRDVHLEPGEEIIAWGDGYIGEMMGSGDDTQHNGVLIVTGKRAVFYRKGFFGEVLETIPITKITSIERRSLLGHRTIRMHTSHDQLEFKTFEKEKETELVQAIEKGRNPQPSGDSDSSPLVDPMDALRKLGELKGLGIVTETEFEAKKVELLSRL